MLLRLACPGVAGALAMFRLPPMSDRDKDAAILTVPQRQVHGGGRCHELDPGVKAAPSLVPGEHDIGLKDAGGHDERVAHAAGRSDSRRRWGVQGVVGVEQGQDHARTAVRTSRPCQSAVTRSSSPRYRLSLSERFHGGDLVLAGHAGHPRSRCTSVAIGKGRRLGDPPRNQLSRAERMNS